MLPSDVVAVQGDIQLKTKDCKFILCLSSNQILRQSIKSLYRKKATPIIPNVMDPPRYPRVDWNPPVTTTGGEGDHAAGFPPSQVSLHIDYEQFI